MEIPLSQEFPFDDSQFEVIVMHGSGVSRERVREANRILKPEGCLFFTVNERTGNATDGYTAPELYKMVREGFDIVELKRPKWWKFGRDGKTMTVCARKKAWREHKGFIREDCLPFTPFRSRT
jgi:SAM-dependent methyltransferase